MVLLSSRKMLVNIYNKLEMRWRFQEISAEIADIPVESGNRLPGVSFGRWPECEKDQRRICALLPPLFSLVTTICLSIFSFSSATWEMMPTSRSPSVRPARVL